MDIVSNFLSVIGSILLLILVTAGLVVLLLEWKKDVNVKRKLELVHRDFLLESLRYKRD